jgi:hypothetical protein
LIALKRDLARSSSKSRAESDQDAASSSNPASTASYQQSSSSSSPLEVSDIETSNPVKIIIDKIKHTVSSAAERRISQVSATDEHHASADASPSTSRLSQHKSVSFAEHTQFNQDSLSMSELQNELAHDTDHASTKESADRTSKGSISDNYDNDFDRRFRQMIKPRRISLGNSKELVYQDLSAEIVAYVLKHALRAIQKENAEALLSQDQPLVDGSDGNDDIVDLK